MSDLEGLLARLIETPSPNPPGDHRAIAEVVAGWLEATGAQVQRLSPPEKPESTSILASIGSGSPVILLHAHTDTVPVSEAERARWSGDPFRAVRRDGRLYGKGSVDDKGPLAAMMIAFAKMVRHPQRRGTLLLLAAAEEEVGGRLGTRWLVEAGHLPPCDFIVVGEQTGNRVATAHKGVLRATVITRGRSVHATNPDRGVNAINAMARIVLALEAYHRDLGRSAHPLAGVPTCNVGVIQGGSTANAVADQCLIRLDRRMIPGESPQEVRRELERVVGSVDIGEATAEVGEFLFSSPFESKLTTRLGRAFLECSSRLTGTPPEPTGYLPGSDAKHLMGTARGDMVIFGPGSYEVAHAHDEYVDLGELELCERILSSFLSTVLLEEARSV